MQVKKFEAPTIQEALDTVKRELGPEAIILQTKKNKRGFGLMSKASVEITAAVSERSLEKKKAVETRIPAQSKTALTKMPATKQADILNKYGEKYLESKAKATQDRVEMSRAAAATKKITATRYIEITDEPGARPAAVPQSAAKPAPARPASALAAKLGSSMGANMTMEEELSHLKRMIEEMKSTQDTSSTMGSGAQALMTPGAFASPALQDAFEQLILNGVDKRYALAIIKKLGFELGNERAANPEAVADQMALELMQSTEVLSPLSGIEQAKNANGPAIIALVGPTGVGKTTTVAKIASEALLKRNLKVGLINLDSYKIAAFDQLGTYGKILNVPFRSVTTAEDLTAAVQDFKSMDLILIDTTGRSQRDPGSLREMHDILATLPNLRTNLVLSVTTRDTELYDMANRFAMFRPQGIIVSKLDEGTAYGSIYNVSQKAKLPLLYFTTGQRVPEDIEEASRERVAALILNI